MINLSKKKRKKKERDLFHTFPLIFSSNPHFDKVAANGSVEASTTMGGFNPAIELSILLLLPFLSSPSSLSLNLPNTTVYEILTKFNLPPGLLPSSVKSYSLSDDGTFEVLLDKPCYVEFEYLVYYDEKVTGKLSLGSITDLEGIQVKRFLLWLNVNEIRVDLPSSGSIYFQVGFINKKLDINQFESPRSCRDNGLVMCGGPSLRQVISMLHSA